MRRLFEDVNAVEIGTLVLAFVGIFIAAISLTVNYLNRRDRLDSEIPMLSITARYWPRDPFPYGCTLQFPDSGNAFGWGIVEVELVRQWRRKHSFAVLRPDRWEHPIRVV